MEMNESPNLLDPFATSARNRPQRTYSHKGRGSRAVSLPALKPAPDTSTRASAGVKLQTFCIRNTRSLEVKIVHEGPAARLPSLRAEPVKTHGDGIGHERGDVADDPEGAGESNNHATADPEEITSPVSPSSHSQSPPDSEEPEAPEAEEDDEDDIIILSQRPLGSTPKHDRRTGNGTRSLRRRPFLIFDKTEAKGYKQLRNKPQPANTLTALRYQPGDGFSGREAKPNGSNLLTRAGKLSVTGHHVGILDLTQSDPALAKKKRDIRRANLDDNSFVSAPKKKARRPLQPKDPNQQLKPAMTAPTLMKKSSSVINAAEKDQIQLPARGPETGHAVEKPVQVAAVRDNSPRPNTTRQMPPDDDEVDMLIIQRSDDLHENPSTTAHGHGMAAEEGQDSCGTHVTDSPQRKLRIRARSVSPDSPSRRTADVGEEPEKWERVFRRFNTQ